MFFDSLFVIMLLVYRIMSVSLKQGSYIYMFRIFLDMIYDNVKMTFHKLPSSYQNIFYNQY